MRNTLAFVLVLLVFLGATNRWFPWDEGKSFLTTEDVTQYERVLRAAPSLPGEPILKHHAYRFAPHWAVGTLARATGVDHESIWRVVVLGLALVILGSLNATFAALRLSPWLRWLCLAVFALNPYALRYYAIVPGMGQDLVFVAGLAVLLLGLVTARPGAVAFGALVATIGRQTAITVLPGAFLWISAGAGAWRERALGGRVAAAAGLGALVSGAYVGIGVATGSFSKPLPLGQMLFWDASHVLVVSEMAEHVARILLPASVAFALAFGAAAVSRKRPSLEPLCAALIAAGIIGQPLLFHPSVVARNQGRLAALGLAAFVVALASYLRDAGLPGSPRCRWALAGLVVALAVSSLHHMFTTPSLGSAGLFAAVHVAAASAAGVCLALSAKPLSE